MQTRILSASPASIRLSAKLIRAGSLVAFPTETVYGLGANAFDPVAVRKIFLAKNRPHHYPLIVHVSSSKMLRKVVRDISPLAQKLIKKFWPGPLTLVLPKNKHISHLVTAGQDTVAVRMPAHNVALQLIALAGVPIAAPSANTFGRPSPTTAAHVFVDLKKRIPLILDDGCARIGVESTILSLVSKPAILRPGGITFEQLKKYIPALQQNTKTTIRASGMLAKHYRPKTPLFLFTGSKKKKNIQKVLLHKNAKVMCLTGNAKYYGKKAFPLGKTTVLAAKNLYAVMRQLDTEKLDMILAEDVPEKGIGVAIMNRLRKAATRTY